MGQTGILLLLILFMGGMLFMSSRQRKKQQAQQDELQRTIHVGDVVRTTSGISGTVVDTSDEQTLDIEIAPDVITTWLRAAVREKLTAEDEHGETPETLDGADDRVTGALAGTDHGTGAHDGAPTPSDAASSTPSGTPSAPSSASADIAGSSRNGSEPSGEVSSPRSS